MNSNEKKQVNGMMRILLLILLLTTPQWVQAQGGDRVVAIVNNEVILKSDVDREIADYMRQMQMMEQPVQFSEGVWYNVLESMIDSFVLLEQAKVDSITVEDNIVDRNMDQRINQLIQQAGSERALEQAFGKSIIELRNDFRDQFREQLITQQTQQTKMQEIEITRPEVIEFFNSIPTDSLPTIPEQVGISQIVAIPEPLADAEEAAMELAQQVRDSIAVHGASFEEMARKYSTGPSAANGGRLPLMPMSDLVPEYSAAAAALSPGQISQVVRTDFGYHIIRLNSRVGDQIETNNLLITVDEEGLDEASTIAELEALRDSVLTHEVSFRELARRHSDDEFTANFGGRILNQETGERLLPLNGLESSLYRSVLLLDEVGEISEPRPFTTETGDRAFRIVRLDDRVPEHRANLDQDFARIRNFALQQKRMRVMEEWVAEIRENVYIEYKIDIPEQYRGGTGTPAQPALQPPSTEQEGLNIDG